MASSNNNNSLPIPNTSAMLMEEFRGLEIYASCAIAIYFYELIASSFKLVKWYKAKLWTIPEVVCLFLEVISTVIYCILTLIFLHYTLHTTLSCTILFLLQQSFFTISTSFHCFILLIRLKQYYPNKTFLIISLFLSAMIILIIFLINIVEFDGVGVNNQDGNCYLSNATVGAQSLSIGFVTLMIYCWVIWSSVVYAMYSICNSPNFGRSKYWHRILFDNGLIYLTLIALSQAINVIMMLDGKNYLGKIVNVTPLLVITSICLRKSLVNTKSMNDRDRTHLPFFHPSTKDKNINDRSIKNIDVQYPTPQEPFTTYQPYPQEQVRMPSPTFSSFTSSTKVDSVPPSLPPIIIHKSATSNSNVEYNARPTSPDVQRITQDFGSSLMFYLNAITRDSNPNGIKLQKNKDRRSKISRLSNLSINSSHLSLIDKGRISQQRFSQDTRKSQQIPILVDPSELFYFTYSNEEDDEVYLFPAIPAPLELQQQQQQQQQEGGGGEEEEEEGMPSFSNYNIRKSNESLTFPIHHPSFGFSATIVTDDDDDDDDDDGVDENIFDHKKVV